MSNIVAAIIAIVLGVMLSFILSWPVMMLWNECLIPAVPSLNQIGWLQAWGISILFGFLFKSSINPSK